MKINPKNKEKQFNMVKSSENDHKLNPSILDNPKIRNLNKSNYFSSPQTPKTKKNSSIYFNHPNKPYLPLNHIRNSIKQIKQQKKDYIKAFYSFSLLKNSERKNSNSIKLTNISEIKIENDNSNNNSYIKKFNNTKYLISEKINYRNNKQNKLNNGNMTPKSKNYTNPSKIFHQKKIINYKLESTSMNTTNSLLSTQAYWNKSNDKTNNFSYTVKKIDNKNSKLKNSNFLNSTFGNVEFAKKIPSFKFYRKDIEDRKPLNLQTSHQLESFENELKLFRKINYINYFLKDEQYKHLREKELNEEKTKLQTNFLFKSQKLISKFFIENTQYFKFLVKQLDKEKVANEFIKYDVITKKNEINSLSTKKDKLLSRLENYMDIKRFLIDVKIFSEKQEKILSIIQSSYKKENSNNIKKIFCNLQDTINTVNRKYSKEKTAMVKRHSFLALSLPKVKEKEDIKIFKKKRKNSDINLYNTTYNEREKQNSFNNEINVSKNDNQKNKNEPIFGSVNEFIKIMNNIKHNIGLLLMYQTKVNNEMEPLRNEFRETYNLLEQSEMKFKKELKMEFIILPQKLKIVKDRNKSLLKKLKSIKKNVINNGFEKKFVKMEQKLKIMYQNIYEAGIYPKKCEICGNTEYLESCIYGEIQKNETKNNILFYLGRIEKGCYLLAKSKKLLKEKYPTSYEKLKKKLVINQRLLNFEKQQKSEYELKQLHVKKIIERANNVALGVRRLNYNYPFKSHKKNKSKRIKKKFLYEEELQTYFGE